MAVPTKIREAALVALEAEDGNLSTVAEKFGVGRASLARWAARRRAGLSVEPRRPPGGKPLLDDEGQTLLLALAIRRPEASVRELLPDIERLTGVALPLSTASRYLRRLRASQPAATAPPPAPAGSNIDRTSGEAT